MIYFFSGTPGSGKSLHAVAEMLRYEKKGFPVLANFQLNPSALRNPDRVRWAENKDMSPAMLERFAADYWRAEGGRVQEERILLVLDECQLIFNSRQWQKNSSWIGFFTQHRKMGFSVILIAQDMRMVDKQIRAVVEYEYKHRKLANAGFVGNVFSFILGSRFLYRREWATVRSVGKGAALGWKMGYYGRRVYHAYDTFKTW